MDKIIAGRRLAGGMPLTLNGKVVRGKERIISDGPHAVGEEIVGSYLLINATNLEEAIALIQSCPIFGFDGYAEVREIMSLPVSSAGNGTSISAKSLLSSSAPDGPLRKYQKILLRPPDISYILHRYIPSTHIPSARTPIPGAFFCP